MRMHAVLSFLAGGSLFLAAAHPAAAEGRVTFNDMVVQKCPDNGNCPWKLSCGVEGKPESEMFAGTKAKTKYTVNINRGLDIRAFPAEIRCTAWRDTGWIGTTWDKLNTTTISIPAGGEYTLDINSRENGSVTVRMSVDSLEIFMPSPAAPAAATGKKAAAAAKPQPTPQYLGIFNPEPEGRAVVVGLEWGPFKKRVDELAVRGLQPMDIETFEQGGKVYWSGIFRSTQISTLLIANQDWDTFLKSWKTVTGSRKRLINFTVYQNGGKANFAGLFRDLSEKHSFWVGQSRKDFEAKVKELAGTQGLRLLDMNAYRSGGPTLLYAGTFRFQEASKEFWTALDQNAFNAKWQTARGKQMQLLDVETYKDGDKRFYDAIVHAGSPGEVALNLDAAAFTARWRDMVAKGLRPTNLSVYRD
ncbi:MAG: hypothetical protein ABIS20_05235 [Thermoanaerobaculia bacterium]